MSEWFFLAVPSLYCLLISLILSNQVNTFFFLKETVLPTWSTGRFSLYWSLFTVLHVPFVLFLVLIKSLSPISWHQYIGDENESTIFYFFFQKFNT